MQAQPAVTIEPLAADAPSGFHNRLRLQLAHPANRRMESSQPHAKSLLDLADRVERLLLRHHELQRTNALLEQQLATIISERDNLRSGLNAARARIDTLLDRLPADTAVASADDMPQASLSVPNRDPR
jgi:uncharacterized protein (TIGR02449 family)